jgi:small subunit ribosomal protein S1
MSADHQSSDHPSVHPPVDVDESYWSALLDEGEYAKAGPPQPSGNGWDPYPGSGSAPPGSGVRYPSEQDWLVAKLAYERDEVVELLVTSFNRGGLLVAWNDLRGFVPASQLVDFPVDTDEDIRRELLATRTNQKLKLRIIELDIASNRLILSERAAQVQAGQRAAILSTLTAGSIVEGTVTNLCDFGAFIDLGGVEGLIHISELSWGRVGHPRDILHSGQKVRVHIMSVDPDQERIALSLKRLQPDPWETVDKRYQVGQMVDGVVTNVVDFGAFACIEEGLEGLIHISELAEGQFLHPRNVVKEGAKVTARILNIDGRNRRLGLSLRGMNANGHNPVPPDQNPYTSPTDQSGGILF